ncbi:MAG: HU family DNA-binding protein [Ruminococcus sp.]|jgi:DNA-binding protein HU-beta|nr:HU family DNA-binding protein [Ruminococcus sp.]MBQ7009177.1 HU family DNA-binding protein [Ruminococcus sp.]MBR4021242.1 HU family DNA-binding protein [Ruminococcus sp.]
MTKAELINSIAAKVDCTKKEADTALNAVIGAITEALEKGDKVAITGFGTFEVRERGEKKCINPRTKEEMVCPPSKAPAFKAGKALKEAVNK